MPAPRDRARWDAAAAADNGGTDGWEMLDRVIAGARRHLRPGGRLIITIFAFLGLKTAFAKLEAAGFTPTIVASEVQSFPRIGYERLEHIRAVAAEASVPAGIPVTVERFMIQGTAPEGPRDDTTAHRQRRRLRPHGRGQCRDPGRAPPRDRQQHRGPPHP